MRSISISEKMSEELVRPTKVSLNFMEIGLSISCSPGSVPVSCSDYGRLLQPFNLSFLI